jgi:hypothetical protein
MTNCGQYTQRFIWLRQATEQDIDNGSSEDDYLESGFLWGNVKESAGSLQDLYGSTRGVSDATIKINQYPPITTKDRLVDGYGQVWVIEGIARGDQEWIVDARRHEAGAP